MKSNKVTKILKIKGGNVVDRPKEKKCLILILFQCIRLIEKIGEFSINDLKVNQVDFLGGSHKLPISIIK